MSKKKSIFIALYFFSSSMFADVLTDKNDVYINDDNLNVLLEIAPSNEQKKLIENKARFIGQIEKLYIQKILAEQAIKNGLDKDPVNAARLQAVKEKALFVLQLNEIKKSDKRDYSKFAKLQYKVNKSDFKVAERVDVAHILIATEERSPEQALEKAKEIRQELLAGADFSDVADRESEDYSVKRNHGELGAFTRDKIVPKFADVAFKLKKGELSEPVKTRFGYHLIKLNKKIPAGVLTFDEVKEGIVAGIKAKNWETDREVLYKKLKKDNQMKIDEKALDKFVAKKLEELATQ
jgi:peptidyl-prolyl cis-trans isomerase C